MKIFWSETIDNEGIMRRIGQTMVEEKIMQSSRETKERLTKKKLEERPIC